MTRVQPHYESTPNDRGPHIEFEAKTPDEAVELALMNLNMTRDEVVVTVLEKGSRGFLGLGARRARVRVEPKTQVASTVRALTSEVLRLMQVDGSVTAKQQGRNISVRIKTEETDGLLIGRKGETLNALQHLLSRMTARQTGLGDQARVMVDVAGYRSRREAQLRRSAQDLAARVERTGRRAMTEPLSPSERRIVHRVLAENDRIQTHAAGGGHNRRVVITLPRGKGQGRKRS